MPLDAMRFMPRFFQHVLPKGVQKVRSWGFLHPSANTRFNAIKQQLEQHAPEKSDTPASKDNTAPEETSHNKQTPEKPGGCPNCGGALR